MVSMYLFSFKNKAKNGSWRAGETLIGGPFLNAEPPLFCPVYCILFLKTLIVNNAKRFSFELSPKVSRVMFSDSSVKRLIRYPRAFMFSQCCLPLRLSVGQAALLEV